MRSPARTWMPAFVRLTQLASKVTLRVLPTRLSAPAGQPGSTGAAVAGLLTGFTSRLALLSAYRIVISSVKLLGFDGLPAMASGAVMRGPMAWPGSIAGKVELHLGKVETPPKTGRFTAGVVPHGAAAELFEV